jgi:DNA polymerase III alpha subunit
MKIVSHKSIGFHRTYSPEMSSRHHNYILDSGAVHANSHGVSYAGVIAYRSLFYKAHFFPEWLSSVLNDCNPKKVPRYMNMARSQGWKPTNITNLGRKVDDKFSKFDIIALEINNLKPDYSAIGNVISVGLLSIKGIGESSQDICDIQGPFSSMDEFIDKTNAGKKVMEPLIRLGSFDRIDGHQNRKALWTYYMYKNKKFTTAERKQLKSDMLTKTGWTEDKIMEERTRQINVYSTIYPTKNPSKYPKKVLEWVPDGEFTLEDFNNHIPDYKISEKISFEESYLGYHLSNPMLMYDTKHNKDINECKQECIDSGFSFMEVIILESEFASTSNGSRYCRLVVNDGINTTTIFVWSDVLDKVPQSILKKNRAIMAPVSYDKSRNSFTILRGHIIIPLNKKD